MHPSKRAQIAHLKADKNPSEVPSKYVNVADFFSPKLAADLPKYTDINNHTIKLVDDQQLPYSSIYSLRPMELEILKAHIENNLANGFIRSSKSPARALILFDKKLDSSPKLYVDYWNLNNLTIKN